MNKYFILSTLLFFGVASADIHTRITELKQAKGASVSKQFDAEVIKAERPVVVLFSAPWCGPCRTFKPAYEQLALSYPETSIKFVYVNIDEFPESKTKYKVNAVPSIRYFKGGAEQGANNGDRSTKTLKAEIKTKLGVC